MTIDVVQVLVTQIKELEGVRELSPNDDPSKYVQAFDTILEYVDDIDIANGSFILYAPRNLESWTNYPFHLTFYVIE